MISYYDDDCFLQCHGKKICVNGRYFLDFRAKKVVDYMSESLNMVNSFLGRMHLAIHLELLNEEQFALVQEGIRYYNRIASAKKNALPYFPNGFTHFGAENVAAGFVLGATIYLAVWCLQGDSRVVVPLGGEIADYSLTYPSESETVYKVESGKLIVHFARVGSTAFFELSSKTV